MTVEYCGANFCNSDKPNIDAACHDLGKEAGKWIMYQVDGKTCYCICSCVGDGTLVTTPNEQIRVEDLVAGSTLILAAGKELEFRPRTVEQVVHTNIGETNNSIYLEYESEGRYVQRVVTMDHPFLLKGGKLVGAGVLQLTDELLDRSGTPVSIRALRWGKYVGRFWEFATSISDPDQNLDGHLVLTDGVVTGDYAVTIFVDYPVSKDEMNAGPWPERPLVGTAAWMARNRIAAGALDPGVIEMDEGVFIPAEALVQAIPDHASAFLPTNQATLLQRRAPLEPISNQYLLDMCEYLIKLVFEPAYPDINFLFNWYDESINAYSWYDGNTDKPYVYLSGGLARVKDFGIQGVTLALAHEVGHLLGRPRLENGVTCEGQADWFGGSVVLRTVWFGEAYFEQLKLAIDQLKLLYRYMRRKSVSAEAIEAPETDATGQPYPSNACRIETYQAAMASPHAPACSLCAEDADLDDDDVQDDDLDIADGEDQFADEEDEDDGLTAKVSGARDRQRRKKRRGEEADDAAGAPMAKRAGARDLQRRKSGLDEDDAGEPMGKRAGARDRQRRKSGLDEDDDLGEPMAKLAGARDRQRRKSGFDEDDAGAPMGKRAGARDRQRRKSGFDEDDAGEPMGKQAGARDRQRRKSGLDEDDDLGAPMAKVAGARDRAGKKKNGPPPKSAGGSDRTRKKKRSESDVEDAGPLAKVAGARDRARKRKRDEDSEYEDLGPMAKIAGARDRAKKKKFRKAEEAGALD